MKPLKLALVVLITTSAFLSCKKSGLFTEADKTDSTFTVDSTVAQASMLQLINDVRQKGCSCGTTAMPAVGIVSWNTQLETAAQAHAADMSKNNYFSHTGLDGSTPGTRITAAGYTWRGYGENIAKGYTSEQAVMNAWLQSEGHCKNIMNANFKEVGVALVNGYWVQEFGLR